MREIGLQWNDWGLNYVTNGKYSLSLQKNRMLSHDL
jgi:hypothetical protein